MNPHLSKTWGTVGVLTLDFDSWLEPPKELRGAIQVGSGDAAVFYQMEEGAGLEGKRALTAPDDLPVGLHLMEVQADGRTIIYRHVEILPGPVGGAGRAGVADWWVEVPESPFEPVVVYQNAGPRGEPGESAYELAVRLGFEGSKEDYIRAIAGDKTEIQGALLPFFAETFAPCNYPAESEDCLLHAFYTPELAPSSSGSAPLMIWQLRLRCGDNTPPVDGLARAALIYSFDPLPGTGSGGGNCVLLARSRRMDTPEQGRSLSWIFEYTNSMLSRGERYLVFFSAQPSSMPQQGTYNELRALADPINLRVAAGAGNGGTGGYLSQPLEWYELTIYSPTAGDFIKGEQGEPGPQGPPGPRGESPSAEAVAEALLPMIGTEMALEGPPGSNNWHVWYFELGSTYLAGGMLLEQFGYRCRFDSMADCATMPVYLGVWEESADGASWVRLGASVDTQVQGVNTDVMWSFEPGAIRLSGRPLRFGLLENREAEWSNELTMGMRVSLTSDTQTKIHYNGSTWTYVPKFFLRGLKMPDNIALGGGLQLAICDSEAEAKNASAANPGGLYATVER